MPHREQSKRYVEVIEDEINTLVSDKDFIGNIAFEVNIKNGGISNMNIIPGRKFVKI